ncbi:hypothetical protein [Nostoc sp.]|uniref:hypothetical protein n=1 Tax=Nostoc sp. TaxID=1180 RepID=UPI002FF66566
MLKSGNAKSEQVSTGRQSLMGSHCGGRVPRHKASGVETPYSPLGIKKAGVSLSRMGEDRAGFPTQWLLRFGQRNGSGVLTISRT